MKVNCNETQRLLEAGVGILVIPFTLDLETSNCLKCCQITTLYQAVTIKEDGFIFVLEEVIILLRLESTAVPQAKNIITESNIE